MTSGNGVGSPNRAGVVVRFFRLLESVAVRTDSAVFRRGVVILLLDLALAGSACGLMMAPQDLADLRLERQQFQVQELMPSRSGGWIFPLGSAPRIVWRDVDEVRRLGRDAAFRVRWFDAGLVEHPAPNVSGRWMASIEGKAPNGTPLRRSFTFYALPQKIEGAFVPDLSVELPGFPGANAPLAWQEHKSEFDRIGREFLTRSLVDCEKGAVLVAGIAESVPLGRPKRYVESTGVVHDRSQLALKLKLQGLTEKVRPLQPPRLRTPAAPVLREGSPAEAGVPEDAGARIDAFCRDWAEATGEPFVTLVARRGVILTHGPYGKDRKGVPVDVNYRCWVASITKTVTALMFSQFVDQNRIPLDAPLSAVFPDYPVDDPHVPTFRQCLNHTSGLGGASDFGGMRNPHLENVILNGIDVNEPGRIQSYHGIGFELAAKAMELVSGECAVDLYHRHFFQPLGFGDVVLGNASSDGEFTAMELGILAQWVANEGSYGELEFIRPATFQELLPLPAGKAGVAGEHGLGMHRVWHPRAGVPANSRNPEEMVHGPRTVGHGSFSGCIFVVDPDEQLVIVQVRKQTGPADVEWYARFFQTIADAVGPHEK